MSTIEEKCKEKGVRLTDQRKIIAKILSESKEVYGSKDHPDVDELHKRVAQIDDKTRVQVNVENLLDKEYYWAGHNVNNIMVARPLNARVTLIRDF